MTYNITVTSKGQQRVEKAQGMHELHVSLALFRSQGWTIDSVDRADLDRPVAILGAE